MSWSCPVFVLSGRKDFKKFKFCLVLVVILRVLRAYLYNLPYICHSFASILLFSGTCTSSKCHLFQSSYSGQMTCTSLTGFSIIWKTTNFRQRISKHINTHSHVEVNVDISSYLQVAFSLFEVSFLAHFQRKSQAIMITVWSSSLLLLLSLPCKIFNVAQFLKSIKDINQVWY